MGITSSRAVLHKPPEPRKSEIYSNTNLPPFTPADRLVCYKLRQETQRGVRDQTAKACDRVSLLQVAPESLQQEDVRPILPVEENQVSRPGHDRRSAELF